MSRCDGRASSSVDGRHRNKSRNAGSANDVEEGWCSWACVRRIKLAVESFRSCNDYLPVQGDKTFANLGRRRGQHRGGRDPACLASGCIGFPVHLAVGILVGDAEDGERSIREPVLGKLDRGYLVRGRDNRLMGEADKQQCNGAKNARAPLKCSRNRLPHSCPHPPEFADKAAVIGQAYCKRNASIGAAPKFADVGIGQATRLGERQIGGEPLIVPSGAPDRADHSDP